MKHKKIITMAIALMVACFLLIGCATQESAETPAPSESGAETSTQDGPVKIGVSFYALW